MLGTYEKKVSKLMRKLVKKCQQRGRKSQQGDCNFEKIIRNVGNENFNESNMNRT